MGRKRDRRQASARRLKLDLSMEDEPMHTEVESRDVDEGAGGRVPPSSSQSGLQENPLSLLGQYSDDEAEEEPEKKDDGEVQVDEKNINAKVANFIAELETSGLLDAKDGNASEEKVEETNQISVNVNSKPAAKEIRTKADENGGSLASMIGDVVQKVFAENGADKSEWKAVLDEGSGNHYYWNAVTGATTWEKPEYDVEVATGYSVPPVPSDTYTKAAEYEDYAPNETDGTYSAEAQYSDTSYSTASTDPMSLIQLGETMVTRFKVLAGDALLVLPQRVRHAIEAEIRLSDCKALAAQGITDGLYWSHMEGHMKRLESFRAVEEAALLAEMEQKDEDVDMEVDMDIDTGEGEGSLPHAPPPPEPSKAEQTTQSGKSSPTTANGCSELETGSVSTSNAIEAAAAAAKKSAKGVRPKKKNTSLPAGKVNKKVSSLVNKWIAVREEMHESVGDEDDHTFDLEALERKRQREIEEWRRDQIASGQALENANFQPLGPTDWRERVKRVKREDKTKSSTKGVSPPDLEELSKDLPRGWKAYWDENTRDVYYGNLSTSETTWDKPTK